MSILRAKFSVCSISVLSVLVLCVAAPGAKAQTSESFLPTWKLLNFEGKQQFISGYLAAWRDAANVTEIAITFVKANPNRAIEGLESVRSIYQHNNLAPEKIVREIDAFYSNPDNSAAGISHAMSFAKAKAG